MLCWAEIQSWSRDKANKCVWEEDVWLEQHTLDHDKLDKPRKKIHKRHCCSQMQSKWAAVQLYECLQHFKRSYSISKSNFSILGLIQVFCRFHLFQQRECLRPTPGLSAGHERSDCFQPVRVWPDQSASVRGKRGGNWGGSLVVTEQSWLVLNVLSY